MQVEAICEHYFCKIPKPFAMQLMHKYAFRETDGNGKRYALMIDVTDRDAAKAYEQRVVQVTFEQTPMFIVGGPEYWGEEYYERVKYIRDCHKRLDNCGDDSYFEHFEDD